MSVNYFEQRDKPTWMIFIILMEGPLQTTNFVSVEKGHYLEAPSEFGHPLLPLRRLCLAMIERAIKDAAVGDETAHEWFNRADIGALSFSNCCAVLGSDEDYVRDGIYKFLGFHKRHHANSFFSYRRRDIEWD